MFNRFTFWSVASKCERLGREGGRERGRCDGRSGDVHGLKKGVDVTETTQEVGLTVSVFNTAEVMIDKPTEARGGDLYRARNRKSKGFLFANISTIAHTNIANHIFSSLELLVILLLRNSAPITITCWWTVDFRSLIVAAGDCLLYRVFSVVVPVTR